MRVDRINLRPSQHTWRAAAASLRAFVDKTTTEKAMKAMYPDDEISPIIMRAASTQAVTTDPSWAGPLARLSVSQAIEDIVSLSAIGKLMTIGALNLDMGRFASMVVPGRSATIADAGQWVAEGAPAPARQLHLIGPTLTHKKLEVIVTMTREMVDASNIEDVVRVLTSEAASVALDAAVFGANAATAAQPAGILNGLTALTPAAAPLTGFEACGVDLGTLVNDISQRNGGARAAFVASPAEATAIRFWAGGQFGTTPANDVLPVAAAAALPKGTVVCVEPESFACSIAAPEFSVADVAAIHQEDTTPANIGTPGTPPVVAAPVKSMFQIDAIALKMTVWANWCMRAPHVSFMNAVTW